jgi:hypothetical protein
MLFRAERVIGCSDWVLVMGRVRAPAPGSGLVDRALVGLSVIPSPRGGGMECYDKIVVGEVNQTGRPRRVRGGHDQHDPRPPRLRAGSRRPGQAADLVIAQPVEDQPCQLAGGGDDSDVAAASFADPVAQCPEAGVCG